MNRWIIAATVGVAAASAWASDWRSEFEQADANDDGVISRREARIVSIRDSDFERVDRNHNGLLELQEYRRWKVPGREQARSFWTYW
ncbi:MAG TPA: hypothetical protein ENK05_03825 [Gammaproteobacteria bacterium]|nr:hypothetical protein [Gammaproteobacteria bacterium]